MIATMEGNKFAQLIKSYLATLTLTFRAIKGRKRRRKRKETVLKEDKRMRLTMLEQVKAVKSQLTERKGSLMDNLQVLQRKQEAEVVQLEVELRQLQQELKGAQIKQLLRGNDINHIYNR